MLQTSSQAVVAICVNNQELALRTAEHACFIAAFLKKELILLTISGKKRFVDLKAVQAKLALDNLSYTPTVTSLTIDSMSDSIGALTESHNAVLIIAVAQYWGHLKWAFFKSSIPFLFLPVGIGEASYKSVILPVGLKKEHNEIALWSLYFARFNSAKVSMLAACASALGPKKLVQQNLLAIRKLFAQFKLDVSLLQGSKCDGPVQLEALQFAKNNSIDLLILNGSSGFNLFSWFLGTFENRFLKQNPQVAVMFINRRKNMYVLCD